jgi:hypothetical protein
MKKVPSASAGLARNATAGLRPRVSLPHEGVLHELEHVGIGRVERLGVGETSSRP